MESTARSDFQPVALTPPALGDPAIAIAASRAGGLGVLDLSFTDDGEAAAAALRRMDRYGRGGLGIRLGPQCASFEQRLAEQLPASFQTLIVVAGDDGELEPRLRPFRDLGLKIILEVTSMDEALIGVAAGVDGLIAKGHEAGGRVGEETAFILLQRLLAQVDLPIWVQGGIGLHTAAACRVAGAAGVVLDWQLALTRESTLPQAVRRAIERMDGSETVCLGSDLGEPFRIYAHPAQRGAEELRKVAEELGMDPRTRSEVRASWRRAIRDRIGWEDPERSVWPLGQDAAFARPLAERFHTVGGILTALREEVDDHLASARTLQPLRPDSPLAQSHGTRYPIVQGPMTRVSDRASFARRVADAGGLPFLALALLDGQASEELLAETRELLGDRPWGVGILGFVPLELRQQQLEAIRRCRPGFALIAGGRPDQALTLEQDGIPTYLHVPSPGLLEIFLQKGSRRFIFEGRECGGHVGPRSSFVLWNTMVDVLLEQLSPEDLAQCHVLFAGGIHDARSSAMVSALAAPLAVRGARVGALLGTSYLFTREAVEEGAIVEGFQQVALGCRQTVLLESGPGHATRCAETPFAELFFREKRRLAAAGKSAEEIREELDRLNLGRLRVGSKGIERDPDSGDGSGAPRYRPVEPERQRGDGMYMIGQLAALRDRVCSIEELHEQVAVEGSQWLEAKEAPPLAATLHERPCDIAIVGMACLLPKAGDLQTYWENILDKVDAITEVPAERWDPRLYFDSDRKAPDKVYSKWGGFLEDVAFDPMRYGIPPSSLPSIEPLQLLTLEVARSALEDAGYLDRRFPRERASVIFGAGGGVSDLGAAYSFRSSMPLLAGQEPAQGSRRLPEWTEDSFAGILLNVAAGRVANRFDLGGINCTVDAACASSLAALHLAVRELESGASDLVLAGGADTAQNPFMYLCFSKTQALSPTGRCRTFDEAADGIAISEGIAAVVLKRLSDAERDGDRIYAVIKAVAGSSDGRDRGLTAPRPEGQARALRRAYAKAGFSPATVGLIEAHGTGTVAGDRAEAETLKLVFEAEGSPRQVCALGSVKSMIGHTKCTAGVAGLIKVALALHHKVLPPTLHVSRPNPGARFEESPFYVSTEVRPWLHRDWQHPRRAGVSAFGFGGTNFHAVVEEYTGEIPGLRSSALRRRWPVELFLFRGASGQELSEAVDRCRDALERGAEPALADLSYALWSEARSRDGLTLAIVAASREDLTGKLQAARNLLGAEPAAASPPGIYFSASPLARQGGIAFLFPGQGSQYPGMVQDLAICFPEVRDSFARADRVLEPRFPDLLSRRVFPPPAFSPEERQARERELTDTRVAQPALGAADMGVLHLLRRLGVEPAMVAGHSYGEYVALCAAGVFDESTLAELSELRGRAIVEAAEEDLGTMASVPVAAERLEEILEAVEGVWIANLNAPEQTVISGSREGLEVALGRLEAQGIQARLLPVACAFHSPLVAPARDRLAEALASVGFGEPRIPVFSNAAAAPYPPEPEPIRALLSEHLVSPVRFTREIRAMHAAGARIFVEVGPRNVLSGLVRRILEGEEHLAIPIDLPGQPGLPQLLHALGRLASHGVAVDLDPLFAGRGVRELDLSRLEEQGRPRPLPPTTWMVNGGRARPLKARTPERIEAPAPGASEQPGKVGVGGMETAARVEPRAWSESVPTAATTSGPPRPAPILGAVPAAITGSEGDAATLEVVLRYQELMGRFLDTQKTVMQTFLRGETGQAGESLEAWGVASAPSEEARDAAPRVVPAPSQAPPGAAVRPVAASPEPEGPGVVETPADRMAQLLEIVSERTGYPPEMLDPNLDLEADLSIDSIKRVEILGAFQGTLPAELQQRLQGVMEQLTRARTLRALEEVVASSGITAGGAPAESAEVEPAEAPAVPSTGADGAGRSLEQWIRHLLEVVSERTGYPPETLDPALDLEADLSIDSIKRVEILGAFQGALPADLQERLQRVMEQLTRARTLGAISELLGAALAEGDGEPPLARPEPAREVPQGAPREAPGAQLRATAEGLEVPRFLLRLVEAPALGTSALGIPRRVLLVTEDAEGVAAALCRALEERGARVARVRTGQKVAGVEPGVYTADLSDPTAVAALMDRVRQDQGPLGGLLHLLPLGTGEPFGEMDLAGWKRRLDLEVKSLLHLARAASGDLQAATADGGAWLLAATSMGGTFGIQGPLPDTYFPGQGGVAGLVKTLALEWPGVRAKVVDLEAAAAAVQADHLLGELAAGDGEVEVGYQGSRRLLLRPVLAEPADSELPHLDIGSDWVLLVTGGARGITAEIGRELAERYRPTLLLVGLSPLPAERESEQTAAISSERELKAVLMARLRAAGEEATPRRVEVAYRRLLKDREIRDNLMAMERAGARVRYLEADVRDESQVEELLAEVYSSYGRLDGVIHGAGIIEDKRIEDKTPGSFDRVFGTKVDSTFLLGRHLHAHSLRFFVAFSSVAGRFGNVGQCDYAAANEVVVRLALDLDRRWPGRVASIDWGPWAQAGMASSQVQERFRERGVQLVTPKAGRLALVRELESGAKGEVSVILGDGPWRKAGAGVAVSRHPELPLVGDSPVRSHGGAVEMVRVLDPADDRYLLDHQLDGRPVLPAAMAIELMAELVSSQWPGWTVVGFRDFRLLHGVVLSDGPAPVKLTATPEPQPDPESGEMAVGAKILDPQSGRICYQASVVLGQRFPSRPDYDPGSADGLEPFPMSVESAYERWLFHGPLFQRIETIEGVNGERILGTLRPSSPQACIHGTRAAHWVIDPILVDSAFQLTLLFSRFATDMTPLPARFRSLRLFAPINGHRIRCDIRARTSAGHQKLETQTAFVDEQGRLLALLEDAEFNSSRSLNRLAGQWLRRELP